MSDEGSPREVPDTEERELTAARPAPGRPLAPGAAEMPLARGLSPREGAVLGVRLVGPRGAIAHADLVTPAAEAVFGKPVLARLGRALWAQLGAKPGDRLRAAAVELPAATSVTVQSSLALSDTLRDRLRQALRELAPVVWPGATLSLPLLGEGSSVAFTVTGCSPEPAKLAAASEIRIVRDAGEGHHHDGPQHDGHHHDDGQGTQTSASLATPADIGGLSEAMERLHAVLRLVLHRPSLYSSLGVPAPRGVLLYGPPGTGKTLLARVIAAEIGANVIALAASDLVGSFSGETEANLRRVFQRAAEHAPTLIIVDEVDVLTTKRDRLASMSDVRAASQLLALLDGVRQLDRVAVLATTNRLDAIDEAFRRPGRFDVELPVLPPDEAGRREILAVHTRDMPLTEEAEQELDRFATAGSAGFTGADLMSFSRELGLQAVGRLASAGGLTDPGVLAIETQDVVAASRIVRPSLLRGFRVSVERGSAQWDELIGLDWEKSELAEAGAGMLFGGSEALDGVLLEGPPGSGKSTLLRAFAGHLGATYIELDGTAVFTQWLGESEAELRAAFSRAREMRPVIVGLEHLEVLASPRLAARGDETGRAADRVLGALLSEIDATLATGRALVVGVTDRPDLIDPAVLRPGRLGRRIELQLPSAELRRRLASSVAGDVLSAGELDALVARTAGEPSAGVLWAARRARRQSMRRDSGSSLAAEAR